MLACVRGLRARSASPARSHRRAWGGGVSERRSRLLYGREKRGSERLKETSTGAEAAGTQSSPARFLDPRGANPGLCRWTRSCKLPWGARCGPPTSDQIKGAGRGHPLPWFTPRANPTQQDQNTLKGPQSQRQGEITEGRLLGAKPVPEAVLGASHAFLQVLKLTMQG